MHSYQWFRRFVEIEGPTDEYGVRKRGVLPSQDRFNHPTSGAQEELCLDMGFLQVTPVQVTAVVPFYMLSGSFISHCLSADGFLPRKMPSMTSIRPTTRNMRGSHICTRSRRPMYLELLSTEVATEAAVCM